jgi:hypothetical protein
VRVFSFLFLPWAGGYAVRVFSFWAGGYAVRVFSFDAVRVFSFFPSYYKSRSRRCQGARALLQLASKNYELR